jgi:hypothetical protein
MPMRSPRIVRLFLLVIAVALFAPPLRLSACRFCPWGVPPPTLLQEYEQATLVLIGTVTNHRPAAPDGSTSGATDFVIDTVLKKDPIIAGKRVITIPRDIQPMKERLLIFCDVYKGKIDPYRGFTLAPNGELVKYFRGALAVKDRPVPERLRYVFDYLNSADANVLADAFREFSLCEFRDYRAMARSLPADKLAGWLREPKSADLRGLHARLLGECGTAKHAAMIRGLLDDSEKRTASGADGLLGAYAVLQPKEGWAYLRRLLKDGKEEFMIRYAALRAVRFFWDERPGTFARTELLAAVADVLQHPDMADFAVEDFRKWQRWEMADRVLDLFTRASHQVPIIRRAIMRYALQCRGPRAALFVREQRQRDPDWVREVQELLELEGTPTPPAVPQKKG